MRRPLRFSEALRLAVMAVVSSAGAQAQQAKSPVAETFDGRWAVTLTCNAVMARGKLVNGTQQEFFVDVR